MIFEPKHLTLKNGVDALFRSPVAADAAQMLDYLKTTSAETDFMLRYPEECTMTQEQEVAFLQNIVESPNTVMILCEIGGKIVGNCCLSFHSFLKTGHRADIAIGIVSAHWNLGIGTAMFRQMIDIAEKHGIMQLELEVIEGNSRAISLYEKMGFRIVAEKPDAIRLKDGTMLKEFIMVKRI